MSNLLSNLVGKATAAWGRLPERGTAGVKRREALQGIGLGLAGVAASLPKSLFAEDRTQQVSTVNKIGEVETWSEVVIPGLTERPIVEERSINALQLQSTPYQSHECLNQTGALLSGLSFNAGSFTRENLGVINEQCLVIRNTNMPNSATTAEARAGLIATLNLYEKRLTVVPNDTKGVFSNEYKLKAPWHRPHMIFSPTNIENQMAAAQLCTMRNLVEGVQITKDGRFIIKARPEMKEELEKVIRVLGHTNFIVAPQGGIPLVYIAAGEKPGLLGNATGRAEAFRWRPKQFSKVGGGLHTQDGLPELADKQREEALKAYEEALNDVDAAKRTAQQRRRELNAALKRTSNP